MQLCKPFHLNTCPRKSGEIRELVQAQVDRATELIVLAARLRQKALAGRRTDLDRLVFLNPPYGNNVDQWIAKLVSEYDAGHVSEALLLIFARTHSAWFRHVDHFPVCLIRGPVRFLGRSGRSRNPAPFPSMIVYLGRRVERFARVFGAVSAVFVPFSASPRAAPGADWAQSLQWVSGIRAGGRPACLRRDLTDIHYPEAERIPGGARQPVHPFSGCAIG